MDTGRIVAFGTDGTTKERADMEQIETGIATELTDIGISVADAQAIKQAILHTVKEGSVVPGEVTSLVDDMIIAFKSIDNEVFARDAMEKEFTAGLTRDKK